MSVLGGRHRIHCQKLQAIALGSTRTLSVISNVTPLKFVRRELNNLQ